ncbi:MAG: ECF-type sigma factor [Aureliella sp.]
MKDISRILSSIDAGDELAASQLLPAVYDELKKLAAAKLAHEAPGQTLQPTALVHEAYIQLEKCGGKQTWKSRAHFFGAAAEAMRQILVNRAIKKRRVKHGGNLKRVELDDQVQAYDADDQIIALHEALEDYEKKEPRKSDLVKLRFFAGLTLVQAAEALNISRATVSRDWDDAKQWFFVRLNMQHSRS